MFRRVHVRAHCHENRTTILAGMLRAAVAVAVAQITKYTYVYIYIYINEKHKKQRSRIGTARSVRYSRALKS